MQRVTRTTAVASPPAIPASPGPPGYFTGGNPGLAIPATVPGYEWFNGVQEELVAAILDAGLTLDAAVLTQMRTAMRRLAGANITNVTGTTALAVDAAGIVNVAVAAASTITLPAANAAGGRSYRLTFVRTDSTANVVTVQRAGSDLIEGLTSFPLPVGGRVVLVSDGTSAWRVLGGVAGGRIQVFTAGGTFVVPSGVYRIKCRVWGGGGGGGGAGPGGGGAAGGSSGGYAEGWYDATPGASLTVTIGTGGTAGSGAPTAGGNGATTSIGSLLSASGGTGGASATGGGVAGVTVAVGTGTGGTLNLNGNPANGGLSIGGTTLGSAGAGAFCGTLVGGLSNGTGNGASFPGGGGGGGGGNTTASGAVGAAGLAIIEW